MHEVMNNDRVTLVQSNGSLNVAPLWISTIDGLRQPDAAVHRSGAKLTIDLLANDHGACATVTFVAAFFGSGTLQVFAQNFQQCVIRWYVVQGCDGVPAHEAQHQVPGCSWKSWQR